MSTATVSHTCHAFDAFKSEGITAAQLVTTKCGELMQVLEKAAQNTLEAAHKTGQVIAQKTKEALIASAFVGLVAVCAPVVGPALLPLLPAGVGAAVPAAAMAVIAPTAKAVGEFFGKVAVDTVAGAIVSGGKVSARAP